MNRKTVFISSVQSEFARERKLLAEYIRQDALFSMYFEPFLFEELPAQDRSAQTAYLEQAANADVYLLLMGEKYGYEDGEGISPTEQEYTDTYVKNHSGAAAGDAITIDGKQAKHFAKVTEIAPDDKKEEHCITVATSNGFIGINTYGMELSIEDVQKIIASIKVK